MKKYIIPIIFGLMIYLAVVISIIKNDETNINYSRNDNEIYTIYLDGEVTYKGSLEFSKNTKLSDFIYDYLTPYSDLDSFNPNEEINNYKTYFLFNIFYIFDIYYKKNEYM